MPDSFKYRFKKLPITQKAIMAGALVAIISVFLPWYKDIDRFNIGDSFLGITGPLYLAGFLVLVAGVISFGLIFMKLKGKALPKLPLKERHFHIFNGVLSLFMLILTASVFFHPKFGINLTDKSMGIGMILAFIGSGIILAGGVLWGRVKEVSFETEGELKPLIEVKEREQAPIRPIPIKEEAPLNKEATVEEAMAASQIPRIREAGGQSWGPVQESINNYKSDKDDTKDIQ